MLVTYSSATFGKARTICQMDSLGMLRTFPAIVLVIVNIGMLMTIELQPPFYTPPKRPLIVGDLLTQQTN